MKFNPILLIPIIGIPLFVIIIVIIIIVIVSSPEDNKGEVYLAKLENFENQENNIDCKISEIIPQGDGNDQYCNEVEITQIFLVYLRNTPDIYPSESNLTEEKAGRDMIKLYLKNSDYPNGKYFSEKIYDSDGNILNLKNINFEVGIDVNKEGNLDDIKKEDGIETDCGILFPIQLFRHNLKCIYNININQNIF